jgi:hypothetical protein
MATDLNPKPVRGPAEVNASGTPEPKPLPKAPPVHLDDRGTPIAADGDPRDQPWPGAFGAMGQVWEQVQKNLQPLIVLVVIYGALSLLGMLSDPHNTKNMYASSGAEGLVYLLLALALPTYALALADRKIISLADCFRFKFKSWLSIIVAGILAGLMFAIAFVLLIFPIIWAVGWFALAAYIIADRGFSPVAALKESKRLSQHDKAKVWGVIGASIALSIAVSVIGLLPLVGPVLSGIGSAAVAVVDGGAMAMLYRWLQVHADSPQAAQNASAETPAEPQNV